MFMHLTPSLTGVVLRNKLFLFLLLFLFLSKHLKEYLAQLCDLLLQLLRSDPQIQIKSLTRINVNNALKNEGGIQGMSNAGSIGN